jgi:hypothetical protein
MAAHLAGDARFGPRLDDGAPRVGDPTDGKQELPPIRIEGECVFASWQIHSRRRHSSAVLRRGWTSAIDPYMRQERTSLLRLSE